MTQNQQFVFHLVPNQLHGNVLYPLNSLWKIAPEIAENLAKKYAGRESIQQRYIPPLDCLWNDVLMFCPVPPDRLMQTFRDEGYDLAPKRWLKIAIARLEPQKTAIYFSKNRAYGDHSVDDSDFARLDQVDFASLTQVPDALRVHIQSARSENRQPFMFVGVPHVLYKGELSLDGIEIIEF